MRFHRDQSDGRSLWRSVKVSHRKILSIVVLAVCVAGSGSPRGHAAEKPPQVLAAVQRAIDYLAKNQQLVSPPEFGLAAYTCLSAGQPPEDAFVRAMIAGVLGKFGTGGYAPSVHHNYEAGVDAMALAAADKVKYRDQLKQIADYLIKHQRPNGSWDYDGQDNGGDTSISQYGMLGLWAAARAGIEIPQKVLDQSAVWHLQTQFKNGAWCYQPRGGDKDARHSMSVAGVGSLGIARLLMANNPKELESLGDDSETKSKKVEKTFGVLERVAPPETPDPPAAGAAAPPSDVNYKPQTSRKDLDDGMNRGLGWLATNYTVDQNAIGWHFYYLYGLERAASLANREKIGGRDWYTDGYRVLLRLQAADGSWLNEGGVVSSTCFAVLFLVRATEKLIPIATPAKPKPGDPKYGGGLLAGGRGLPTDMTNVDNKGGNITARKMDTPLDKLLAELENPKSQKIESAQAAIVEAIQVGQREQLIGQKDLLLKLAKDSRVDVRRTAFWALARCNDLRIAPVLIQGLMDTDFDAAVEARNALCVLSRRPRGFGLPDDLIAKLADSATPAEKDSAFEKWREQDIRRWREWYQSVRPYSERDKLPD